MNIISFLGAPLREGDLEDCLLVCVLHSASVGRESNPSQITLLLCCWERLRTSYTLVSPLSAMARTIIVMGELTPPPFPGPGRGSRTSTLFLATETGKSSDGRRVHFILKAVFAHGTLLPLAEHAGYSHHRNFGSNLSPTTDHLNLSVSESSGYLPRRFAVW